MSIVIDANVAIAIALPLAYSDAANERMRSWIDAGEELVAPVLWSYEIASALRKCVKLKTLSSDAAKRSMERILALGVVQVPPTTDLHLRALDWAARLDGTVAYDAAYVALAHSLDAELWTADGPLWRAATAKKIAWIRSIGG